VSRGTIVEEMEYFFVQLIVSGGLQTDVILGAENCSVVNIIDSRHNEPCEFVIILYHQIDSMVSIMPLFVVKY